MRPTEPHNRNDRPGNEPRVSVVIIGYAPPHEFAQCLAEVRAQLAGTSDAEVLIVAHLDDPANPRAHLKEAYAEFNWVDTPPAHNVARMRGLGIARSRASIVALLEGDCVPAAGWFSQLMTLEPSAAIGGAVEPGPFVHGVDWAAYFCEFAKYMLPIPETSAQLPGANVVYRRAVLPDPEQLEAEGFYETFVNAGVGGGSVFSVDPCLVVQNCRTWRPGAALAARYHHGRGFAGLRTRGMSMGKRLPYVALGIALPAVLIARVLGELFRRRRFVGRGVVTLPWIAALSASWAIGEIAGYLAGPGTSLEQWR